MATWLDDPQPQAWSESSQAGFEFDAQRAWARGRVPQVKLPVKLPCHGQRTYERLAALDVIVDGERLLNEVVDLDGARPSIRFEPIEALHWRRATVEVS